jgi:hypothetical protein
MKKRTKYLIESILDKTFTMEEVESQVSREKYLSVKSDIEYLEKARLKRERKMNR